MSKQVQVKLDQEVYEQLELLCVPPYNDINAVVERLLHHGGHKSRELIAMETEARHRSLTDEIKATEAGIYDGSGIST